MRSQQDTIGEILDAERDMVINAAEKYGDYFINASEFNYLFQNFLESVNMDRFAFGSFLAFARKHATLALFSAVRLHHVQTMLDMRQVLEAGASAAFGIANPDLKHFLIQKDGIVSEPKSLSSKRYAWLDKHFPAGSVAIQNMKTKAINAATAHASLTYAQKNFAMDGAMKKAQTPFFDFEVDHHVKTDLWMIGNVLMGLMDLFYGINKTHGGLVFQTDFIPRLKALEAQNLALKQEMESSDWYAEVKKRQEATQNQDTHSIGMTE